MNKTAKKIEEIIGEIEKDGSLTRNINEKKSTSQVVNILLGQKNEEKLDKEFDKGQFQFDLAELLYWKEKNNEYYRVEYYRGILTHRRFFGKTITLFKRVIRKMIRFLIEPIVKDQNEFNASITSSINALCNNEIVTQNFIEDQKKQLLSINERIDQVSIIESETMESFRSLIDEQNEQIKMLKVSLEELIERQRDFDIQTKKLIILKDEIDQLNTRFDDHKEVIFNKMRDEINTVENKIDSLELNFIRTAVQKSKTELVSNNITQLNTDNIPLKGKEASDTYNDIDYFNFENHFRGPRGLIKKNLEIYTEYFINKGQVVDLGCGRGEFLELMKENNIPAIGVDFYKEFVDFCNFKGLQAIEDDAIKYLNKLDDNSVGGIFSAQLIEHLQTNQLIRLCIESYKKLKRGGYLILETPNPTSLSIYTNAFYIDPSHVKPVHPKTLEYFLNQAGFKEIQVIFTEQSKVGYRLPLLNGEGISNLNEFNDGINCISDIIFGSQDYAIIAQK